MNIVSLILFHLLQNASKIFTKRQIKKQENYLNLEERMRKWRKWVRKRSVESYANRFLRTSGLNNIATYRFLKHIILQNSVIFALSKEIGNLPYLEQLDLSNNFLGYYNNREWLWLEQIPIRNNLIYLNLSRNLLTVLPIQIMMLKKLRVLHIRNNKLTHLPHSIGILKNLTNLDISNNELLYLPANIFKKKLLVNAMDNLFRFHRERKILPENKLPSLFEYSARIVLKQWRQSDFAGEVPIADRLIRRLFDMKYCIYCESPCLEHYVKWFVRYTNYIELCTIPDEFTLIISPNSPLDIEYVCPRDCSYMRSFLQTILHHEIALPVAILRPVREILL